MDRLLALSGEESISTGHSKTDGRSMGRAIIRSGRQRLFAPHAFFIPKTPKITKIQKTKAICLEET